MFHGKVTEVFDLSTWISTDQVLGISTWTVKYLNFLPSTFYITGIKYLSKYLVPVHGLGIQPEKPMEDLSQEEQMKIYQMMFDQRQKAMGLPTSEEQVQLVSSFLQPDQTFVSL